MSDSDLSVPTPLDVQSALNLSPAHPQPWLQDTTWQERRNEIAQRLSLTDDARDELLTAQDDVLLNLQAERLALYGFTQDGHPPLTAGNTAPREGQHTGEPKGPDSEVRDFVRDLLGKDPW
ncbi:hypothetical protein QSU92_01250 [Microbacterium sp. ET2]|uniref:hypothetical protein n=1 Tax=Microbacterium albipurpureum TaxID=3050384 RepID=UPI00259CA32D|nr:hypothetical protein [Microbacterium sp. ET2 (Ac-2212)]WJL95882.1 hypothetical protein QSU92_01250 [Microbacterium sp. ET2 (Ac-2212)]